MANGKESNGNSVWVRWVLGILASLIIAITLALTGMNSQAIGSCATETELRMHVQSANRVHDEIGNRLDRQENRLIRIENKIDKLIDKCSIKGE